MKMEDLRSQCEALGLAEVVTYIQTGNVVFSTPEPDTEHLAGMLEAHLAATLGYTGKVFVLSPTELEQAGAANPFDPARRDAEQQCHLMFLAAEPETARVEALMAMQGEEYRFAVRGKVLYYAYDRAAAPSRRTINFEKVLGVAGTARTWKVVDKLIDLAERRG